MTFVSKKNVQIPHNDIEFIFTKKIFYCKHNHPLVAQIFVLHRDSNMYHGASQYTVYEEKCFTDNSSSASVFAAVNNQWKLLMMVQNLAMW